MNTEPGPSYIVTYPHFDNILNLRDVGKTVSQYTRKSLMVEGLLYRSARPGKLPPICTLTLPTVTDDASLSDRSLLKDDYSIKTIMDLRTKSEHVKQLKKRQKDSQTAALLQSNDALAEPMKIPGIGYLEINLNGKGFERSLLWQLSFWSFLYVVDAFRHFGHQVSYRTSCPTHGNLLGSHADYITLVGSKLVILILLGYRMKAISILGREVMQPRGLVGLGHDSIDFCGPEIAQAFQEFASETRYPMLIHCTQGKDRTGLLVALILLLLDVPLEAITYDYCQSESELLPEQESRLQEIREIGLTEDFAKTPKNWIPELHQYLEQKYGGVRSYLATIGVDGKTQDRVVDVLRS